LKIFALSLVELQMRIVLIVPVLDQRRDLYREKGDQAQLRSRLIHLKLVVRKPQMALVGSRVPILTLRKVQKQKAKELKRLLLCRIVLIVPIVSLLIIVFYVPRLRTRLNAPLVPTAPVPCIINVIMEEFCNSVFFIGKKTSRHQRTCLHRSLLKAKSLEIGGMIAPILLEKKLLLKNYLILNAINIWHHMESLVLI
jgi:hypothetical protein